MSNPTTPFSWQMPTATDLVTDLPADFEVFGQAVATSMADLLGGTTGQILAKNSATDMDFVWIANDQGDITGITATTPLTGGGSSGAVTVGIQDALTTQKGAVQLSDSTSTTSSILAATPTAVKAAYDLADGAIAKTTVTTAGDIIYRNATVPVRLGIGTAGQVLTVNSGATAPQWTTLSSSSGLTLISTTTLSGATTNVDGVFTSTYDNYLIQVSMDSNTSIGGLTMQLRASGTATTTGYYYGVRQIDWSGAVATVSNGSNVSSARLGTHFTSAPSPVTFQMFNPNKALRTTFQGLAQGSDTGASGSQMYMGGFQSATTQFDGFSIVGGSQTGKVRVYGYSN